MRCCFTFHSILRDIKKTPKTIYKNNLWSFTAWNCLFIFGGVNQACRPNFFPFFQKKEIQRTKVCFRRVKTSKTQQDRRSHLTHHGSLYLAPDKQLWQLHFWGSASNIIWLYITLTWLDYASTTYVTDWVHWTSLVTNCFLLQRTRLLKEFRNLK